MPIRPFREIFAVGFLGLALLFYGVAFAGEAGFKNLRADELKQLLDSDKKVFLLNPLPKLMYRQGNIPGSVNIRWHSIEGTPLLPFDKETIIVTYCMGTR